MSEFIPNSVDEATDCGVCGGDGSDQDAPLAHKEQRLGRCQVRPGQPVVQLHLQHPRGETRPSPGGGVVSPTAFAMSSQATTSPLLGDSLLDDSAHLLEMVYQAWIYIP
jgi:hypothetical protein